MMALAWVLASLVARPAMATSCASGASFLLHPVSLDAAHRNTRVVYLSFGTGRFSVDDPVVTIDGAETTAFDIEQQWMESDVLTVVTFDELLPPFAEVVLYDPADTEQLRFATSDVVDEIDPWWDGGVERVERDLDEELSFEDCSYGKSLEFKLKDYDDDLTPPDDLLVETVSQYGEKAWALYGWAGGRAEDGASIIPSLEYDYNQRFEVTFYDEAGNASETHTVSACGCTAGSSSGALALPALPLLGLLVARRRR